MQGVRRQAVRKIMTTQCFVIFPYWPYHSPPGILGHWAQNRASRCTQSLRYRGGMPHLKWKQIWNEIKQIDFRRNNIYKNTDFVAINIQKTIYVWWNANACNLFRKIYIFISYMYICIENGLRHRWSLASMKFRLFSCRIGGLVAHDWYHFRCGQSWHKGLRQQERLRKMVRFSVLGWVPASPDSVCVGVSHKPCPIRT